MMTKGALKTGGGLKVYSTLPIEKGTCAVVEKCSSSLRTD